VLCYNTGSIHRKGGRERDVQSTRRGVLTRERASCVARTWIALSVDRMCASCPRCAPKAPFVLEEKVFSGLLCRYYGVDTGASASGGEEE
jgi:hypothetical protein